MGAVGSCEGASRLPILRQWFGLRSGYKLNDKHSRLALGTASLICASGASALISAAVLFPPAIPVVEHSAVDSRFIPQPTSVAGREELTEEDFQFVWGKKLQQPKEQPKPRPNRPAKKVEPPKPPPKPAVRLNVSVTGIIKTGDYSRAWLSVDRRTVAVSPGDVIESHPGSPTVKEIGEREVDIELAGEMHTVSLPDSEMMAE